MEFLTLSSSRTTFNPYPSSTSFFTSFSAATTRPSISPGETAISHNVSPSASDLTKTLIPAKYQVILLSFAYGIISLLAVLGNSCIIYIVLRNRRMHSVTNYFVCNLALADCLVACFAIPFQVGYFLLFSTSSSFSSSSSFRSALFLMKVSSSSSSKMGSAWFSLQISSVFS